MPVPVLRAVPLSFALVLSCAAGMSAQTPNPPSTSPELYKTVAALDTALFDAYNHCDLDKMGSMVAEDLEFYHDQTGLSVGKQSLIDGVKNNICGKVERELVATSLEVYPLKGYGAVEVGVHRFHHTGDPGPGGEAKFVMLWQELDGPNSSKVWKLTRVISFDHYSLPAQKPAAK